MTSIAVVINPIAGGGRGKKVWRVLEPGLNAVFSNVTYRMSNRVNDLELMTAGLLEGNPDYLLIIGGDGTLNHVLNGIIQDDKIKNPNLKIAFFNAGCGGDFIRQFPQQKITEFLDRLSHNQSVPCDIGKISSEACSPRYFINIASCGLSGYVVSRTLTSKWLKKLGGTLNYLTHSILGLLTYRSAKVRVQIDDNPSFETSLLLLAVCSGQFFGGRMHVAPMAIIDDGLFDVVLFSNLSKVRAILKLHKIYSGSHVLDDKVHYVQAKMVTVEPLETGPILIESDGENAGQLPATFSILNEKLALIV
ncbi:diacylglycerol/lipid kinase family protein [Legionella waltersii]|uniref:Transcriptional regulator n=1 Tax=Legionella waltersii TaxID=66969 RepID=A0A0W1AH57_9GAMM|nr:diacylglycerol kinase family protein [Legionella waltersii]KTD80483.1 transcriptional regulator [Legionella waltersii]SNV09741.1 transcriptional regulator [Legionella waltersii]